MENEKCTWKTELHNGEPCPFHNGITKHYSYYIRKAYDKNKYYYKNKNLITGKIGENLNKKLRNNEKLDTYFTLMYNKIKANMYKLDEPIHLYRSDMTDIWNKNIGDKIIQKGFLYTSGNANKTKEEDRDKFTVFAHLITNKNTKLHATNYEREDEIVLDNNLTYQIIGKSMQNIKGRQVTCYTILIK